MAPHPPTLPRTVALTLLAVIALLEGSRRHVPAGQVAAAGDTSARRGGSRRRRRR